MLKRLAFTVGTIVVLAATASAQNQPPVQKPAEVPVAAQQPQPRPPAQLVNIRLELTITDQRGDASPPPKTITMFVADRESGRIRTSRGQQTLNVDARPEIIRDGRIKANVSLEYTSQQTDPDRTPAPGVVQSMTAILEDGKSVVLSQSADPVSERKVKVELKSSIVR